MVNTQTLTRWTVSLIIIAVASCVLLLSPLSTPIVIGLILSLSALIIPLVCFGGKEPLDHIFDPDPLAQARSSNLTSEGISDPIYINETWILRN